MGGQKVYAVRKGHRTGVLESWSDCQAATNGYPGAEFKSFPSQQEAHIWLGVAPAAAAAAAAAAANSRVRHQASEQQQQQQQQRQLHSTNTYGGSTLGKFYAIARGRSTGVFPGPWDRVKGLVEGYSNPVYKGFATHAEAQAYLQAPALTGSHPAKRQCTSLAGHVKQPPPSAFSPPPAAAAHAGPILGGSHQALSAAAIAGADAGGGGAAASSAAGAGASNNTARSDCVSVFFDGGSRGNPGRAGYGYAVFDSNTGQLLRLGCRPLRFGSTNNQAEYSGMIAGMEFSLHVLGACQLTVKGDSELVVRQMQGKYKVSGERLLPLYREAKQLQQYCNTFNIEHIYREDNKLADQLSNLAMDTDEVVDQIGTASVRNGGGGGAAMQRKQVAQQLAKAAQVDQDQRLVDYLCQAPQFLVAAAHLLSRIWDDMPFDEVVQNLQDRGWDQTTGGPPVPGEVVGAGQQGLVAAAVVGAAVGAAGSRNSAAARDSGQQQQLVPVAPVALGPQWADEIRRQEVLLQHHHQHHQQQHQYQQQHHQQQQRPYSSDGYAGGSGGSRSSRLRSHQQHPEGLQQPDRRLEPAELPKPFACNHSSSCRSSRQQLWFGHPGGVKAARQGCKCTQTRAQVLSAPNRSMTWGAFQAPVTAGPGGRTMRCAGLPPERTTSVASGRTRRGSGRSECRMLRAASQRHRAFLGAAVVAGALLGLNDSRMSSKRTPSPLMRLHT